MEPGQEPQVILRDADTLSFRFTLQQAKELASSITILVSSGGDPYVHFAGRLLMVGHTHVSNKMAIVNWCRRWKMKWKITKTSKSRIDFIY